MRQSLEFIDVNAENLCALRKMLIGWVEYCRDLCCVYVCPSQTHFAKYFDGGAAVFLGCGDKRPDVMTSECH